MNFKRVILASTVLGLLGYFNGCSAPLKLLKSRAKTETTSPETTSADTSVSALPVLYTDKDSLQSGTGVMDDDAPLEFTTTRSGLKYRVLRNSDEKKPLAHNTVTVNEETTRHLAVILCQR